MPGKRVSGYLIPLMLGLGLACGEAGGPEVKAKAPSFSLEDFEGKTTALADYAGEVVVIDFWATWCAPCLEQIPILNTFAANAGPDVHVLGVAVDAEGREVVEPFLETTPIDYPVLFGDEALARSFGALGFPALVVVDAEGRIDSLHMGVISPELLDQVVQQARH